MGELSMKKLVFHHDVQKLPQPSHDLLPVLLYGINNNVSYIGNNILDNLKQKGIHLPIQAMDFLSIALSVTAADRFIKRDVSADGWSRQHIIELPLCEPERWEAVKTNLEKALYFLSGDTWSFTFLHDGKWPPAPTNINVPEKILKLRRHNCVCLFSGGLDSTIGVIDLIADGFTPLLVSHSSRGDKAHQDMIKYSLKLPQLHYQFNLDPHLFGTTMDISMRTRSFNFLALGILSVCILQSANPEKSFELILPENGFISLNAPLTSRRIGSLSTRTTHPYFIKCMKEILKAVSLPYSIRNPYQFNTKGEMVINCKDQKTLKNVVDYTVSCSHWLRRSKQCGICVPCLIRRAALFAGNIKGTEDYCYKNLVSVLNDPSKNDDIQSILFALTKIKSINIKSWILSNASLPHDDIDKYANVFRDGLLEVKAYLNHEGIK